MPGCGRCTPGWPRGRAGDRAAVPGRRPRPAALGALHRGRVVPLLLPALGRLARSGRGRPLRRRDARRRPGWSASTPRRRRATPPSWRLHHRVRPQLRVTAVAAQGAIWGFVPPMPLWVTVLTPARPAWAGLVSVAAGLLPRWARRLYGLPGLPATTGDLAAHGARCSRCPTAWRATRPTRALARRRRPQPGPYPRRPRPGSAGSARPA